MSETPNDSLPPEEGLPRDAVDEPGAPIEPAPARAASVRLRDESDTEAAMMDPANQSLADALRITFVLVQVAMIVLAALFVFSGFQTVREGERGLSVLFGRAVRDNLEPGFHFSAPYPFGELVKIGTGNESVKVLREFWPYTQEGREEDSIDRLVPRAQIDPQRDGSLITADLNIAHTQWQAVYRRTDPTDFVKNILPEEEEEIVRAALTRGVVRTLATTTIDDLLRPQAGGTRAISQRALEVAQSTLDRMDAGITIEQFELGRKTPPIFLLSKFQAVLDARSEAQQAISEARTARDSTLNEAAGEASAALLWLIGKYELMLEVGDRDGAADVLARDALGRPVRSMVHVPSARPGAAPRDAQHHGSSKRRRGHSPDTFSFALVRSRHRSSRFLAVLRRSAAELPGGAAQCVRQRVELLIACGRR